MATTHHTVQFRRKRKGLTNYKKRLSLLLSHKPRLVVRRTSKNVICQLIQYNDVGDTVLVSATSQELKNFGWKFNTGNSSAAYLTGLLLGKKAKDKGVSEGVLDIGLHPPKKGSKIFYALKGAIDAGLQIPHKEESLPQDNRIDGSHIVNYAESLKKENQEHYKQRFSALLKNGAAPETVSKQFADVKTKILQ